MYKTWLIIKREYLSRVRKRSFILITLLVPVLIVVFIGLEVFLLTGGNKETQRIAVIDDSGLFHGKLKDSENIFFTFLKDKKALTYKNEYKEAGYDGLLYIPAVDLQDPKGFTYYSSHQLGLGPYVYITDQLNSAIENQRMINAGIDREKLNRIKANVSLQQPQQEESGVNTEYATYASTAVAYVAGFLIYFALLLFGTQVMRGVAEEKTNRVAEVMVSSVKPFQLMVGKIVGVGGVGLTQFIIWIICGLIAAGALGAAFPSALHHAEDLQQMQQMNGPGNAQAMAAMQQVQQVLTQLPIAQIIIFFIFYFFGGYLLYAALFAAIGSAVDQDLTESQSLTLPITLPIILSFFVMFNAIQQPNSPLSVFCSIFPLSSPLVMMARIPYGVPWWQLGLSVLLLVLGFLFTTWLAGRIYRTGILMYGKKVTFKEMIKWAFAR